VIGSSSSGVEVKGTEVICNAWEAEAKSGWTGDELVVVNFPSLVGDRRASFPSLLVSAPLIVVVRQKSCSWIQLIFNTFRYQLLIQSIVISQSNSSFPIINYVFPTITNQSTKTVKDRWPTSFQHR